MRSTPASGNSTGELTCCRWPTRRAALKYLAPYVFRVAISDNRIEQVSDTHVTYRFTPTGKQRSVTREVTGEAFTRSFLQHVLPSRFQKVRHYGFWGSNCRTSFEQVRMLVWFYVGWFYYLTSRRIEPEPAPQRDCPKCPECGNVMRIVAVVDHNCRTLVEHSLKYLDSG